MSAAGETPTVDDVQYHVLRVKALARELFDFVEPKETTKRLDVGDPGYAAWWKQWNERGALVDMMQSCVIDHLGMIEAEVLSLRARTVGGVA